MNPPRSPTPAELYEAYLVPGIHARWTPVLLSYAQPRSGERVLDVACGTGVVARNVAPRVGEHGAVVALDASAGMLAVARAQPEPPGAAIEWVEADAAALPGLLTEAGFERVELASESRPVRFPSPERFVALTLSAAIIPGSEMGAAAHAEMVETVGPEVSDVLQAYVDEDEVAFPMHAHIAVAYA